MLLPKGILARTSSTVSKDSEEVIVTFLQVGELNTQTKRTNAYDLTFNLLGEILKRLMMKEFSNAKTNNVYPLEHKPQSHLPGRAFDWLQQCLLYRTQTAITPTW
jgi:hypothetical protein